MTEPDPGVVEQTVRIAARPETVWRFWTDPVRLCDWWGVAAEADPRPGGTCRVEMGTGHVMRGEYLELVPYERIVFSFGWEPIQGVADGLAAVAPGSTRVEVTLADDSGDTVLTLRHTGIPTVHVHDHRSGWDHFLSVLASTVADPPSPAAAEH